MFMLKCYEFIFYIFHNLSVNVCISRDVPSFRAINQDMFYSLDFRLCSLFQKISSILQTLK